MPENRDNNFNRNNDFSNDIPKLNNEAIEMPRVNEVNQQENKPIIEIPQAYYDKLAKEQQEKMEAERATQELKAETAEAFNETGKFLSFVILNAIVIFVLFYITLNYFKYAILGVPAIIFILTIVKAFKEKEKSAYPSTVLAGGMVVAMVTFILSMVQEDKNDLWMNYTIVSAGLGFLGMMASSIITNVISAPKDITAVKGIGYILYFVLLIGAPIYAFQHYREEIYKYFFNEQVEVEAETETEFILKTLKNRYGIEFNCGIYATPADEAAKKLTYGKYKSQLDQFNRRYTERICQDSQKRDILVQSKTYSDDEVQYIVIDNYIDVLFLNKVKENLVKELSSVSSASSVMTYLYPKENCTFYGDCVDIQDYFDRYDKETSVESQFKVSTALNFEKELNLKPLDYVNSHQYKYVLKIVGTYNSSITDYSLIINNILNKLNSLGYKNTLGYEITLLSTQDSGETEQVVYKVKGESNTEQSFNNPEILNISANK